MFNFPYLCVTYASTMQVLCVTYAPFTNNVPFLLRLWPFDHSPLFYLLSGDGINFSVTEDEDLTVTDDLLNADS